MGRAFNGHAVVDWTLEVEQLSQIKTQLAWANWQRGGKASAPKPKPDRRPGQRGTEPKPRGRIAYPKPEVKDFLDSFSYRPPPPDPT